MALFSILAAENRPNSEFWDRQRVGICPRLAKRFIEEGRRSPLRFGIVECTRRERQGIPAV
jgi:hypothetical protein